MAKHNKLYVNSTIKVKLVYLTQDEQWVAYAAIHRQKGAITCVRWLALQYVFISLTVNAEGYFALNGHMFTERRNSAISYNSGFISLQRIWFQSELFTT